MIIQAVLLLIIFAVLGLVSWYAYSQSVGYKARVQIWTASKQLDIRWQAEQAQTYWAERQRESAEAARRDRAHDHDDTNALNLGRSA